MLTLAKPFFELRMANLGARILPNAVKLFVHLHALCVLSVRKAKSVACPFAQQHQALLLSEKLRTEGNNVVSARG